MIPKLVVTAALMVAEVALTMTQKIKGPRLDDLSVSLADYGTPIPRFWGKRRLNPQIIWAKPLRERKKHNKTKGGKYTEYKYYGTWAVLICDHEIDDVSRIWFDKRLVFDKAGTGPISIAALLGDKSQIKLTLGGNMRLYTGTETQLPDPVIEAWCEDRYGADTCPAYRGSSYIVFEDIPLEQVGNRIPQITVEAINNKVDSFPYETKTTGLTSSSNRFFFSASGHWCAHAISGGWIEWWDTATRTNLGLSPSPGAATSSVPNTALANDGTAYQMGVFLSGDNFRLITTTPLGAPSFTASDAASSQFQCTRCLENTTTRYVYTAYASHIGYLDYETHVAHTQSARDFCIDSNGEVWALFHPSGSSSNFNVENLTAGTVWTIAGSASARSGPNSAHICYQDSHSQLVVISDGYQYGIDPATGLTNYSVATSASPQFVQGNPYEETFWDVSSGTYKEYSLTDGSLIRSVDKSDWLTSSDNSGSQGYDPVTHSVWANQNGGSDVYIRFLDRVDSDGVTLQTVVDDVSTWCGLTGQDTTALTQTVLGYSVTQGPGKDMIAPLLDIHDVDARPHDFSVQFVNRGSSPSGTILTEDFVRQGDRYKVTIQQDTDLPREVTINFADWDHDQQPNNVKSPRPVAATSSSRSETIDLSTYADTPDSAQQKVDRYQRRLWNSRERVNLSLTAQKLALEPGDVTTISLDGATRNVRLDKMTITPSQIDCEFVRDETSFAALNTATGGPSMDGRDPETIYVPAITRGFVMDIPLIQDSDNDVNPLIYVAAGGYSDPWPGAFVYRGDDGTYDEQFAIVESSSEATWGLTTEALGTCDPNVWDRGNTINVNFLNGTPTTVTEAEIDADTTLNLAAIGSQANGYEIVQFTTATIQGDGTYDISGFKRGRRGTEGYVATHVAGDEFILLNHAAADQLGTDDVGDALSFKATTAGRSVDSSPAIDVTYTGASLKPYAPARLKVYYDGTDLQCTITRRTRVGGAWNGGSTIPLSENSEEYEVDVYNGATLKRTITVTGTNAFTYTAAQATADGITLPVLPTFNVYQMSDAVGRGFALAA